MNRRIFSAFLAIAALAVMTLPTMAKDNSSAAMKGTIIVTASTKVGSATLAPGQYDVTVEANQVKFEQHGKVVAEAPCTMKDLTAKSQQTGFQVDNSRITELEIAGKTQAAEFTASQGN
jgi:hypothetical protein